VNGHSFSENGWFFAEDERAVPSRTMNLPPQANEVMTEAAFCLAVPLELALVANIWLAASGVAAG
jgi:hypothetical protein